MTSLEEKTQGCNEYLFYLNSDHNNPIHKTCEIEPYINLSEYIKIFVHDIKENNHIIFPGYVTEEYARYFINFVETFKQSETYKICEINDCFEINIQKPVQSDTGLWKDIGHELFSYTRDIINRKKFITMMNTAMCLNSPILAEALSAKIALDIKYLTKTEIEDYFKNVV